MCKIENEAQGEAAQDSPRWVYLSADSVHGADLSIHHSHLLHLTGEQV